MPAAVETGLFDSLASFTQPTETQGATGNFTADQIPVAGLQDIACMDAPAAMGRVSATERRAMPQIEAERLRHVLLSDCYPTLREAAGLGWQCSITDPLGNVTLYDLLGAEDDSQATQTRCNLQKVTI